MKPSRAKPKQTAQALRLIELAQALNESSSRLEDDFWDVRLTTEVNQLLAFGKKDANSAQAVENTLTTVLEPLYQDTSMAYSALVGTIESCIESKTWPASMAPDVAKHGQKDSGQDTLLIAIPILAWSRFPIPWGGIPLPLLKEFRQLLQTHILASNVKLSLCNQLFSPDQLPQTYVAAALFADQVMQAARLDSDLAIKIKESSDNTRFLSDSRYLIAAICAPKNTAGTLLFRWQEEADGKDAAEKEAIAKEVIKQETPGKMSPAALSAWVEACKKPLAALLPACAFELQPVKAYHAALLAADRASRPWSINAAVAFLHTLLNHAPDALFAVVARFQDGDEDEYRISLILRGSRTVVYGVIWPLLPSEEESGSMTTDITAALNAAGVSKVVLLDRIFPIEYCDDCGAALYPDAEGEVVHIEWPEDQDQGSMRHLH
jgi:hypothetical protein